jgi:hypothetical protein
MSTEKSENGAGLISFDKCMDIFKSGGDCQMLFDGKWIPFEPAAVIRKFRLAPQLSKKDGPRVVRYALYRLSQIMCEYCQNLAFGLPEKGPKPNWKHTYPVNWKENQPRLFGRLKDIFKTYFRIVSAPYKNEHVVGNGVVGVPHYIIQRRCIDSDQWVSVFAVRYMTYNGYDKYESRSCASWEGEHTTDWGIVLMSDLAGKYIQEDRCNGHIDTSRYLRAESTDHFNRGKTVIVRQQRIFTLDPTSKPGDEVLHNIALVLSHYLEQLSSLDIRFPNFKSFIDKQLADMMDSSYTIYNGEKCTHVTMKESVFDAVKEYMEAVIGKLKHGDYYQDYVFTKAIMLRYFNDKYNDTIDRVDYSSSF